MLKNRLQMKINMRFVKILGLYLKFTLGLQLCRAAHDYQTLHRIAMMYGARGKEIMAFFY